MDAWKACLPLVATILIAAPACAADLVEPWDAGFSDFELYLTPNDASPSEVTTIVGVGLAEGLSLGISVTTSGGSAACAGIALFVDHPIGHSGDLDLWVEAHRSLDGSSEQDALHAGAEWSVGGGHLVPYARLSLAREASSSLAQPLVGVMLPFRRRLQLHAELSAEWGSDGGTPIRLALGPNFALTETLEAIPELAIVRQPGTGTLTSEVSLGFVMNVQGVIGRLKRPHHRGPRPAPATGS